HAAADGDTHGAGDHRVLCRDHRADSCADAHVCVGHEGDVTLDDRKPCRLLGLADGLRVDVACPGDELVVDVGGHGHPLSGCRCVCACVGREGIEPPAVGVGDHGATTGSSPKDNSRMTLCA